MITLEDHQHKSSVMPIPQADKSPHAVADAISALERALVDSGHTPGTFALILGNGAVIINEPVFQRAASAMLRKGDFRVVYGNDALASEADLNEASRMAQGLYAFDDGDGA